MADINDREFEDTTKTLEALINEASSEMDPSATQLYELILHLAASLDETVGAMTKTTNANLNEGIGIMNVHLAAMNDEIAKLATHMKMNTADNKIKAKNKTEDPVDEKVKALTQRVTELEKELKELKAKEKDNFNSQSAIFCTNSKFYTPSTSLEIFPHVHAKDYTDQKGTVFGENGEIGYFDDGDHLTYSNLNFGPRGTTKSIRVHYAKGGHAGKVELRLGGPSGRLIAEWTPGITGAYEDYINVNIGIDEVEGVHDLTFVGRDSCGIMNLRWFELHTPKISSDIFPHVHAKDYTDQKGTAFSFNDEIGYFSDDNYLTYSNLNFGPRGTTKSIRIHYAKGDYEVGKVELRLGGPSGRLIAEWISADITPDDCYVHMNIGIDEVEGVHDLTFVGKEMDGLSLKGFELSKHKNIGSVDY